MTGKITQKKFNDKTKIKQDFDALKFSEWFSNKYEIEHKNPYPNLSNKLAYPPWPDALSNLSLGVYPAFLSNLANAFCLVVGLLEKKPSWRISLLDKFGYKYLKTFLENYEQLAFLR